MLLLPFTCCLLAKEFLSAANGNDAKVIEQNDVNEQIAVVIMPPKATRLKMLTMNALHLANIKPTLRGTRSHSESIKSAGNPYGGGGGGANTSKP